MKDAPNCYECKHRREVPGDCHLRCANPDAKVVGNAHGIRKGWFFHPINFDPVWLVSCTGYEAKNTKETAWPAQI